jgi:DNA polymerase (family 10)
MENKEIASVFKDLSRLMELHGENEFKSRSYQNASFRISKIPVPLKDMSETDISSQEGIGKGISQKILELLRSGSVEEYDQLLSKTPEGIREILEIKGLGPKKVKVIWNDLGITSPGELLYACNENRLVELKGFGEKTQDQIRQSLEFFFLNQGWFHYAEAALAGASEKEFLKNLFQNTPLSEAGAYRRKCEVLKAVEFLMAGQVQTIFETLRSHRPETVQQSNILSYDSESGIPVHIHIVQDEAKFGLEQIRFTGSEKHTETLLNLISGKQIASGSEEEVYKAAGMSLIPPECRENGEEFTFKGSFGDLVRFEDLKGCLHNHSTYSDGIHSLKEMADECHNRGLEYFAICDHSRSAFYANGLSIERVKEQHQEIEKLNESLSSFRIFKGIESDILPDGSLDYADEILASFDLVVASVHSVLKMDIRKATDRIIKAVSNPYTTILGHPTGRLLLAREGYPLDMEAVIDACAHYGVVIELNAHPYRLDLDWRWIPKAVEKGIKISINPDAHRKEGIGDMQYGVYAARKGMLTAADTFNALSLAEMEAWLSGRKQRTLKS